ncbi:hypothetical protein QF035_008923 [Streptomyces umbrinus]|uniref:Uncharacterized protein n=1 Tax=Streptomyces umbrinus TaxID=67370 RepID=A0ABU0T6C9_9ACTN|nr:hypothetical protein [Streptomyces umbrinus]
MRCPTVPEHYRYDDPQLWVGNGPDTQTLCCLAAAWMSPDSTARPSGVGYALRNRAGARGTGDPPPGISATARV